MRPCPFIVYYTGIFLPKMNIDMELNDWVILITALGGIEGAKQLVKWVLNRKYEQRKEDASADAAEYETERQQVDWLEKRLAQRDAKVDALYGEVRKLESEKLDLVYKNHELELQLKEADMKKCLRRGCGDREPPSDY